MTRVDMEAMHGTIRRKLLHVYRRMNDLWQEKDGTRTGKFVMPERASWTNRVVYEIEFKAGHR